MKSFLSLVLFSILLTSCVSKENIPDEILPPERMIPVLMEMHIAEAVKEYSKLPPTDSTRLTMSREYYELFDANEMDAGQFFDSFNWYLDHPAHMDEMYGQLIEELNKRVD